MSIQYPKKYRGGANPAGPELTHILRDPPKSIYTRKYEPVNIADVMYMSRPGAEGSDPTRINESINYIRRGINPMVKVMYGNAGGGSTNSALHNGQVKNPYRIEVVRPPLQPPASLVPISAPRIHQNYTITTNVGIEPRIVADKHDRTSEKYTTETRKNISSVRPSISSGLTKNNSLLSDIVASNFINYNKTDYGVSTNIAQETGNTLLADIIKVKLNDDKQYYSINSAMSIYVYDPKTNTFTNVQSNIKERNNIAVNAVKGLPIQVSRNDGIIYNIKDYDWKVVNTNSGAPAIVIEVQNRDIELERNMPLYAVNSNISTQVSKNNQSNTKVNNNEVSVAGTSGKTNFSIITGYNEQQRRAGQDTFDIKDKLSTTGYSYEDRSSRSTGIMNQMPVSTGIKNDDKNTVLNEMLSNGSRFASFV
jgi:hypothetical protein